MVCGLLLRFEFMNERVVFLVRIVELGALAHNAWRLVTAMMKAI